MRVKIGDKWHSSDIEPICLQVNEVEQKQIAQMDRSVATSGKYAVFPDADQTSSEEKLDWMQE